MESYRLAQTPPNYPSSLQVFANANPPYIDSRLGSGICQGYNFIYSYNSSNDYNCMAAPITAGVTGNNVYYVDASGIIRLDGANGQPID